MVQYLNGIFSLYHIPKKGGTVRLQGADVTKVQNFKYFGSAVQNSRKCGKEVKK